MLAYFDFNILLYFLNERMNVAKAITVSDGSAIGT